MAALLRRIRAHAATSSPSPFARSSHAARWRSSTRRSRSRARVVFDSFARPSSRAGQSEPDAVIERDGARHGGDEIDHRVAQKLSLPPRHRGSRLGHHPLPLRAVAPNCTVAPSNEPSRLPRGRRRVRRRAPAMRGEPRRARVVPWRRARVAHRSRTRRPRRGRPRRTPKTEGRHPVGPRFDRLETPAMSPRLRDNTPSSPPRAPAARVVSDERHREWGLKVLLTPRRCSGPPVANAHPMARNVGTAPLAAT